MHQDIDHTAPQAREDINNIIEESRQLLEDLDCPFQEMIGQKNVKKKLNFYLKAFNKTGTTPFLSFFGAKGLGKTAFAKLYASKLKNRDGTPRPFLELNCSTIKNNEAFFEQIFLPIISNNEITVLFDEAHALPKDLTMSFLSIFNTSMDTRREFSWGESNFVFDFKKQTYLFATTESDKIFPPLKDRLTGIDFEPYNYNQLGRIIKRNTTDLEFEESAMELLATTVRGNARNAVKRAQELQLFCESESMYYVDKELLAFLFDTLGILPHGISNTERQILEILQKRGSCTLQTLSAKTGLSPTSLRRDHELYLLRKSFMVIDGTRQITKDGKDCLKEILL